MTAVRLAFAYRSEFGDFDPDYATQFVAFSPERIFGARVSGSLFPTLGTPPLLGRAIEPSDDRPDHDEVLVLGYRVWQRLFAGS